MESRKEYYLLGVPFKCLPFDMSESRTVLVYRTTWQWGTELCRNFLGSV